MACLVSSESWRNNLPCSFVNEAPHLSQKARGPCIYSKPYSSPVFSRKFRIPPPFLKTLQCSFVTRAGPACNDRLLINFNCQFLFLFCRPEHFVCFLSARSLSLGSQILRYCKSICKIVFARKFRWVISIRATYWSFELGFHWSAVWLRWQPLWLGVKILKILSYSSSSCPTGHLEPFITVLFSSRKLGFSFPWIP